jgi:hypothetical protein
MTTSPKLPPDTDRNIVSQCKTDPFGPGSNQKIFQISYNLDPQLWKNHLTYLTTVLSVSDLPDSRVQLDVKAVTERHWYTAVPITNSQM